MSPEEFKMIMSTVQNVTDGAVTVAVLYMVGNFLQVPVQFAIIGTAVYKTVKVIVSKIGVSIDVD